MRYIFIVNPAAGKKNRSGEVAWQVAEAAKKAKVEYEVLVTSGPRHACELVKEARQKFEGHLRFVACGGDGTLKEVADGVSSIEDASIGHYPCGTGNDYIRMFGDPAYFSDLDAVFDTVDYPVDYIDSNRGAALNILSVGMDARIAHGMQKYKRLPLVKGQGSYNISLVENLLRGIGKDFLVTIDGKNYDGKYTIILVANGKFYGGGYNPVPEADITDETLDILLIKSLNCLQVATVISKYKQGRYSEVPQYVTHLTARSAELRSHDGKPMIVNLDGETSEYESVSLKVSDKKLVFAMPRKAYDALKK